MNRLLLIGLNHTTAPLAVRERLAFAPAGTAGMISQIRDRLGGAEVVVLSTCNRVELYLAADKPIERQTVVELLSDLHQLPAGEFESHLYERRGGGVVRHLFSVASSLDSMVLGETQILGQVKQAYELSLSDKATGPLLNPLFQRAVSAGKEVLTATGLGEGRVSIASVAVDYARRIFDTFADKTVLCLGTGKMSRLVLQNFRTLHAGELRVVSRDLQRAEAFARQFGGRGVAMADLDEHLVAADVIVTGTAAPEPVITRDRFAGLLKRRRYRPAFLIDIAVPRDIEPAVGELDSVYLYNIDDLQQVVNGSNAQRSGRLDAAQAVVDRHVAAYERWQQQQEVGPLIDLLYQRAAAIAETEVTRTLEKMPADPAARQQIEELAHRIVRKLLHDPVTQLRERHGTHESAIYAHAIEQLFGLAKEPPREKAE